MVNGAPHHRTEGEPSQGRPRMKGGAGYSGTPLPRKLGIKDGHRLAFIDAPEDLPDELRALPASVHVSRGLRGGPFDVILLFADREARLRTRFAQAARALQPNGGLWVAWPKKASGVPTDITEDRVRAIALVAGLVDNKVCAIDATWSGLRCVYRLRDRPARARPSR